jgi:YidC/Oxa1 family membrane protein insertase
VSDLWNSFRDLFVDALELLHGLFVFVGDEPAWGVAIIALTLFVRILMLPLAIKQTRSMRGMQELQPQIKAIQKKYKADKELLRKDPERYKAQRQKMNQELTSLYQDSGVNPMGGCLPLLAQAPVFFALFTVLRAPLEDHPAGTALGDLLRSDFFFFTPACPGNITADQLAEGFRCGLATGANAAGLPGILLILAMAGSMFWAQRQMLAKSLQVAEGPQLQQQKILMYVMPVFLAVISFAFPVGVLLYWATTNMWQVAQQAIILREVQHAADDAAADRPKGKGGKGSTPAPGGKNGGGPAGKGGTGEAGGKGSKGSKGPRGKGGSSTGSGKPGSTKPGAGGSGKGKGSAPNGDSRASGGTKGSGSGPQGPSKGTPGNSSSSNGGKRNRPRGASDHLPSRRSRRDRD